MESTREIFWNVGHGVVLPMYLFVLTALIIFASGFWKRLSIYRQGCGIVRWDHLFKRIVNMVKTVLTQSKVIRIGQPGAFHAVFFWSFAVLFAGTLIIMVQADLTSPAWGVTFLKGPVYKLFSLAMDISGLSALIMIFVLLVRRFILRPEGLIIIIEDYIIHCLLLLTIISGFIVESLRIASTEIGINQSLAYFSPVGLLIGQLFIEMKGHTISMAHRLLWWIHFFLALSFIVAIPFTKLRHILTTGLNYLFSDLRPQMLLTALNLEAEESGPFGARNIKNLTWKDIYDSDACTSCNRCQDRCPAYLTGKPLSPMKMIQQIGDLAFSNPTAILFQEVREDALWSCTTCGACQEICPASIEHIGKIINIRRYPVLMESRFPQEYKQIYKNLEIFGDSMGKGKALREDWDPNLKIKRVYQDDGIDLVFWTGCMGPLYDERSRNTLAATGRVLQKANLSFGILGKEEVCCGDIARRTGNEYLFQQLVKKNIELFNKYKIKKIVTNCPHCFNSLKNEYPQFGSDVEVLTMVDLTEKLVSEGLLKITSKIDDSFVYHDPCYMGRHNSIYKSPRSILGTILAHRLKEMKRSKEESFCCGAGGGNIWRGVSIGGRIEEARVEEAVKTGANGIATSCPYCEIMFYSAAKQLGMEYSFRVSDIMELLDRVTIQNVKPEPQRDRKDENHSTH